MISFSLLRLLIARVSGPFVLGMLGPVILGAVTGVFYPLVAEQREPLLRLLKLPLLKRFLPIEAEVLLSPAGSFALPLFHPLTLTVLAVGAALVPLSSPAGDRGKGSLDLLLTTPLGRMGHLRTVLAATVLVTVPLALAPIAGICLGSELASMSGGVGLPWALYWQAVGLGFLTGLAFGGVALLFSVLAEGWVQAAVAFAGIVFWSFLIEFATQFAFSAPPLPGAGGAAAAPEAAVGSADAALQAWAWTENLGLFAFYDVSGLLEGKATPGADALCLVAIAVVSIGAAFVVAQRRSRA